MILAGIVGGAAVALQAHQPAQGKRAQHGLRNEEAHLDVLRRQHAHHRAAGRHPFAFAVHRVEDQAGLRRGNRLLVEPPVRLRQHGPRGLDLVGLRLHLLLSARQPRHIKLTLQLADMGRVAAGLRQRGLSCSPEIPPLWYCASSRYALLRRFLSRGLRLYQLRLDYADLRWPLPGLKIRQSCLRGGQLLLRLVLRGPLLYGVQGKKRRATRPLVGRALPRDAQGSRAARMPCRQTHPRHSPGSCPAPDPSSRPTPKIP